MNEFLPHGEERYFAAANTYQGFVSYYEPLFEGLEALYILKGGSGTGKSRMLREFGAAAEAKGEQVMYLYCSFDPDSLDGVLLPKRKIAMADGTTPHILEARFPGVRDTLVDLGQFWNTDTLRASKDAVVSLITRKKAAFSHAYRLLRAASHAEEELRTMTLQAVDRPKLQAAAERMLRELPKGSGATALLRPTEALGRRGEISFDTPERYTKDKIALRDRFEIGDLFLAAVADAARSRMQPIAYSPMATDPTRMRKLVLTEAGICFSPEHLEFPPIRTVNTERFIRHKDYAACRSKIRFCQKMRNALINEALVRFSEIGALHFAIEEIYAAAMDFSAKEAFSLQLIDQILQ